MIVYLNHICDSLFHKYYTIRFPFSQQMDTFSLYLLYVIIIQLNGKKAFEETGSQKKAIAAVDVYEVLTELEKKFFYSTSDYVYAVITKNTETWSTSGYNAEKVYDTCVDIMNIKYVNEFIELIESIEEPYTRADIDSAKAIYTSLHSHIFTIFFQTATTPPQ